MSPNCKHPRVRLLAREEDAEYFECQECGEIFDSEEFRDMGGENAAPEAEQE